MQVLLLRGLPLVAQLVKNLPAMQKMHVQSVGRGDPLEEEMATHSSILAWKIPRTEESGGLYSPWGPRVGDDLVAKPPPPPLLLSLFFLHL